jgi:hypothetical protein
MICGVIIAQYIRPDLLLLLAVANSAPVLASMLLGARWSMPIDGGGTLSDGRPLFGSHKTWRGLLGGMIGTGVVGAFLPVALVTGAVFGLLALSGDLVSSFIKRRAGFSSGKEILLLDQVPESLLPLLILYKPLGLTLASFGCTLVAFAVLAIVAARLFTYRRTPGTDARNH